MCDKLLKDQQYELEVFFNEVDYTKIEQITDLILKDDRSVYFCGVGKSENIGSHTADMLKSIGIKAYSISPTNSLHGDLGAVRPNDLIFMYSKSGNTRELINTVKFFKSHGCYVYGVFCNSNAKLISECDDTLIMPVGKEIDGNFDLVPTTSFLNYTILCNILVSRIIQKKELTLLKYGKNHPAGDIGRNALLTVGDIMILPEKIPIVDKDQQIKSAMLEMTIKNLGICLVTHNDKFYGVFSDGDLRRVTLDINNINIFHDSIEKHCNTTPTEIITNKKLSLNEFTKNYFQDFVPVIENKKIVGLVYRNKI